MVRGFSTIGHSTRPLDELLDMLRGARVQLVVDVRAFPRSRTNPVFNIDSFPARLEAVQIGYCHSAALGGRRSKQADVDPVLNAGWRVRSFHNYADYALGDEFATALAKLMELGQTRHVALMCSEAVWWRCHRRIITDYILFNDHAVTHLMGPGQTDTAEPTPFARKTENGKVVYPASSGPRASASSA